MSSIKKISIKGFKSILDQEIDLGRLNVFIGTNGAGKSNLLEAIATLSASIEGGIDYERLSRRGARLSSHNIFRSAFKNKKRATTFSVGVETDSFEYNMSINAVDGFSYHSESLKHCDKRKNLCGRSNKGATLNGKSLVNNLDRNKSIVPLFTATEENIQDLSDLENFAIYSPSTPILRGVVNDTSNKSPLGLYGGRLAEALKETIKDTNTKKELQRFFNLLEWFRQIGTAGKVDENLLSEHVSVGREIVQYKDKFMKENFNNLYAYDVSEGALFILFVLLLLSHPKSPNFFALDNIDTALNPGLVRNLMNHVADLINNDPKKQIILTTHNPTTLDAIDLFNDSHRLFVVNRAADGQTTVKRITPPEGMTKKMWQDEYMGMRLSEIWLSGAIGGLTPGF